MAFWKGGRFLIPVFRQLAPSRRLITTSFIPIGLHTRLGGEVGSTWRFDFFKNLSSSIEASLHLRNTYKIKIITGNVRNGGTTSPIKIKLVGTRGESDFLWISRPKGFEKGKTEEAEMELDENIGKIRMVIVERTEEGDDVVRSWFLDKIVVEDANGNESVFPCMQWFGVSDDESISAPRLRHLLPQSTSVEEAVGIVDGHENEVKVKASGMVIPHPDKVLKGSKAINKNGRGHGGEDSYFYVTSDKNKVFGMGVADGVYAWREKGIDPGIFSYYLIDQAYHSVRMGYDDVYRVLKTASRKMETEGVYGSSTCCLLTINMDSGRVNGVSLGDSGFVVIGTRGYNPDPQIILRTPAQEHEFGFPFQLGHHEHASKPKDALLYSFQVLPGDTIVMGTDGLFDNLFLLTIVEQVDYHRKASKPPQVLAGRLIHMARDNSLDKTVPTPYSNGFMEEYNLASSGGKKDDISVIVAYIS